MPDAAGVRFGQGCIATESLGRHGNTTSSALVMTTSGTVRKRGREDKLKELARKKGRAMSEAFGFEF